MFEGPPTKAGRSGGLQEGHMDAGNSVTNQESCKAELQDADGSFSGNLVNEDEELSAKGV